jgi:hypothetical protein
MHLLKERHMLKIDITELNDKGKGRAFIILSEPSSYQLFAKNLFDEIAEVTRSILLETPVVTESNWRELTASLLEYLNRKNIRQASFIAFSDASSIVLNLSLNELKLVRSMVIIDAATRPHPSFFQRLVDKLENFLPLGLPLRSYGKGFDAKSFLQRMRCPVLVITSHQAGHYIKTQTEIFKQGLPTAWAETLSDVNPAHQLQQMILEFQQTPAKCPQKNTGSSAPPR